MEAKHWIKASLFLFFALLCYGLIIKSQSLVPVNTKVYSKSTVIIDAGHGFPDNGAVSSNDICENKINLNIAKNLEKLLKKAGIKVIMTRNDYNSLSTSKENNKRDDLKKRAEIRDTKKADLFLSIHLNHFSDPKYSGAQVFFNSTNEESKKLAETLQANLAKVLDPGNKRVSMPSDGIYILKNSKIPCALAECGFLSNPDEANLLNTAEYQKKVAAALYCGICEYLEKK